MMGLDECLDFIFNKVICSTCSGSGKEACGCDGSNKACFCGGTQKLTCSICHGAKKI